jgi:hypothetical protein
MNDLDDQLAGVFERLADAAPHHPDLAGVTRRRARRRRTATVAGLAAAAVAATVTGLMVLPDGVFHGSKHTSDIGVAATPPCESTITRAVLPDWARTGFSDPEPVMPFVRSASGNVVAILFTDELASPPRSDIANKVLWVWDQLPADTTSIHAIARLNGTGPAVTAGLPAPAGPSYVDLPTPGCWRLTLTWPGGSDTIDLRAVPPQDATRQP